MSGSVGQQVQARPGGGVRVALAFAAIAALALVAPAPGIDTADAASAATSAYVALTPYRLADTRLERSGNLVERDEAKGQAVDVDVGRLERSV